MVGWKRKRINRMAMDIHRRKADRVFFKGWYVLETRLELREKYPFQIMMMTIQDENEDLLVPLEPSPIPSKKKRAVL